jgi:hypothetical protein
MATFVSARPKNKLHNIVIWRQRDIRDDGTSNVVSTARCAGGFFLG